MKIEELLEGEVIYAKFIKDDGQSLVKSAFNSLKKIGSTAGFKLKSESFKFGPGWVPSIVFERVEDDLRMSVNVSYNVALDKFYIGRLIYVNGILVTNSVSGPDIADEYVLIPGDKLASRFEEALKTFRNPLTAKQKNRLKRGGLK